MSVTAPLEPLLARFDRSQCASLAHATSLEWIETDGLGGFASSTLALCPTRRYHGLLVTQPDGFAKRHVFLARYGELLTIDAQQREIAGARHGPETDPSGHAALDSFSLSPWPTWSYRFGDVELRRELILARGVHQVFCRYTLRLPTDPSDAGQAETAPTTYRLELRPWLAMRAADDLTFENDALAPGAIEHANGFTCRPYEALPAIAFTTCRDNARFEAAPLWDKGLYYAQEEQRGYPCHEDQFSPGTWTFELEPNRSIVVAAALVDPVNEPRVACQRAATRRHLVVTTALARFEFDQARHAIAAHDFVYRTPERRTGVIAGYPWFLEWGRDAYLALPGLTLALGEVEECGEALSTATRFLSNGLLPNIFGTSVESSHYGSVDAALWFARAVRLYELAGGDPARIADELLPALLEIANAYADGIPRLDVHCDEGGLIVAGRPDLNPTWMDAQTSAGPVTPRDGCAVEINALWAFLLEHLEMLTAALEGPRAKRVWSERRRRAKKTFLERFWLEDEGYLADVWKDGVADRSVRPNMVLAAALEFSPLKRVHRTKVVDRARAELLTPRGLRTLSPNDPAYVGRYAGGCDERDGAYHQGTVWPWLFGFFCEAHLRAFGSRKGPRRELLALLDGMNEELDRAGIGHVSEVFDGDPPHRPGGTIAQAWNTAELLRARVMLKDGRP